MSRFEGSEMTAVRGSVQRHVGGMELLARHSLKSLYNGSVISLDDDIKVLERLSINDRQFNWKLLRDQFKQRNMEPLYRLYEDKLRLGYLSMFLIIQVCLSVIHIVTYLTTTDFMVDTDHLLIAMLCYSFQAIVPILFMGILFAKKITKEQKHLKLILSAIVILVLIATDILVPVLTNVEPNLRPAYYTNNLLTCYIFLPIKGNIISLFIGIIISLSHIAVMWTVTYSGLENESKYRELGGDVLYLFGVNFLGVYYRVMNEVISRRSFLDRRACVESTLKLNFEKDQEERLLLSILPEHIAIKIRHELRTTIQKIQTGIKGSPMKNFHQLIVSDHDNVSVLYADVVNYTMITTTLAPKMLIEILNELFGKFDEASEDHDVLRIKFLGDCYYCVSGVPKPNPQHAKSCVDLGLEMISIIKDVREIYRLPIDMRIGVHSGKIFSGIIGIKKWQFDIWSKDVTIANKMESTGKAGKVHITNQTLLELADSIRDYIIEPHYEARNDPLLSKYKIETYLVSNPCRSNPDYPELNVQYRRASVGMAKAIKKRMSRGSELNPAAPRSRITTFIDNNLMAYRRMMRDADAEMSSVIDKMPSGIMGEYRKEDTMSPWTLLFRNKSWEKSYIQQPDLLFKYFIAASLCILVLMMAIQALTIENFNANILIIDGTLAVILVILLPLNWTQFFWSKSNGKDEPTNKIINFFYQISKCIVKSAITRNILYFFVTCMLAVISLINLVQCDNGSASTRDGSCIPPWHLAQVCFLGLLLSFLFCRVFFLLKWGVGLIITGVYIWIVWDLKSAVFEGVSTWNVLMDPRISQTLAIVFITASLHMIDRQTEFRSRLDHRWKRQLTEKQEDASTMKVVNNLLLHNILPAHVADIYLNTSRDPGELYYEEYSNVAVMFASLTDYKFSDDDSEVQEANMLKYLNQLISDFDKLLLSENHSRLSIEKIKMAGWTYMAACGLDPSHRDSISTTYSAEDSSDHHFRLNQHYENEVVLTMVEFAVAMMDTLGNFNKATFQGINLKVGISHGGVTAGVVGSKKPLYDIWGNAVNMASRMDSTGEAGKIQVTENTAKILDRQGVITQYRGLIFVKGVGDVRTYYVPLDKHFNLLYKKEVTNVPRRFSVESMNDSFEESPQPSIDGSINESYNNSFSLTQL